MKKIAYLYKENTGEFDREIDVYLSPEEEGVYLLPERATELPPPMCVAHEAAVFSAGAWSVVADFRGQTVYDRITGAARVVDALGALPPDCAPGKPDAVVAGEEKTFLIAQIKADLAALDARKIRPMAEGDTAYLATLNAQSAVLRAELAAL